MGILQAVYILEAHYTHIRRERLEFLADVSVAVWGDKKAREKHVEALSDGKQS